MSEVLVMEATPYKIIDEQTGEINEGTSVKYYDLTIQNDNGGGCPMLKANLPYADFSTVQGKMPGFFKTVQGRKVSRNKIQEVVTAFEFIRPFSVK